MAFSQKKKLAVPTKLNAAKRVLMIGAYIS